MDTGPSRRSGSAHSPHHGQPMAEWIGYNVLDSPMRDE